MLSEKIKQLRCQQGMSQQDLAERLSVVRQTVSKWEKGLSVPDSDMLIEIAFVLGVSVSELAPDKPSLTLETPTENKKAKSSQKAFPLTLIILGSPIWLSIGAAALAVILSLYLSLWSVIVSLWAVTASFAACSVGGIAACGVFIVSDNVASGLAMLAAGIFCAGLAIFMFFGCKAATNGTVMLTKKIVIWIKNRFRDKGAA